MFCVVEIDFLFCLTSFRWQEDFKQEENYITCVVRFFFNAFIQQNEAELESFVSFNELTTPAEELGLLESSQDMKELTTCKDLWLLIGPDLYSVFFLA